MRIAAFFAAVLFLAPSAGSMGRQPEARASESADQPLVAEHHQVAKPAFWIVEGSVQNFDAKARLLEFKTEKGLVALSIAEEFQVSRRGKPLPPSELKRGRWVKVTYVEPMRALKAELVRRPPNKKAPPKQG